MSKHRTRRQRRHSARGPSAAPSNSARAPAPPAPRDPPFTPVAVRGRHDGWTPVRQDAFIKALAETANVEEACAAVGMSPRSAYNLRARVDAESFRQAWDAALDYAVDRLADAMMGRALHGVAVPVFYKGEQIGERRRYDERLGIFLLRTRAPERYGKWRDGMVVHRAHPDGAAKLLDHSLRALAEDNLADAAGRPRPDRPPLRTTWLTDLPDERAAIEATLEQEREQAQQAEATARHLAYLRTLDRQSDAGLFGDDDCDDVVRTS